MTNIDLIPRRANVAALRAKATSDDERWICDEFVRLFDVIEADKSLNASLASRLKGVRDALILAEDVLSRSPFSTQMWPNGMHPNTGIETIRAAVKGL